MGASGEAQVQNYDATGGRLRVLSAYPRERGSLIPILQGIQEEEGFLSREAILETAAYLDLPASKIFGVATFYNQFRLVPPGRFRIQICRGTACHVRGSLNLLETLETELGISAGETARDRLFSLETVACMGACSIAPVVAVNGEFYGRLDRKKLLKIIKDYRARAAEEEARPNGAQDDGAQEDDTQDDHTQDDGAKKEAAE